MVAGFYGYWSYSFSDATDLLSQLLKQSPGNSYIIPLFILLPWGSGISKQEGFLGT